MRFTLLQPDHVLSEFDCGDEAMSRWLRNEALAESNACRSRTHVLLDDDDRTVRGYFTLSTGLLDTTQLSKKQQGRGSSPYRVGFLLAKLAVDTSHQRHNVGRMMLGWAMYKCVEANTNVAMRYLIVNPSKPELVPFYEKSGFQSIKAKQSDDAIYMIAMMQNLHDALTT